MAAGQQYNKHLNYDQGNVKGAAIYDANLDEWVMLSAQVVKTEGGVLIYQRGTDDGRAKVDAQLTGSILAIDWETGQPVPITAQKDDAGDYVLRMAPAIVYGYNSVTQRIKVESNGAMEIVTHSEVVIRDTANHQTDFIDVSMMPGKKILSVRNALDQAVTVSLFGPYRSNNTGGGGVVLGSVSAGLSGYFIGRDTDMSSDALRGVQVLNAPAYKIIIRLACAIAPTSGSVTAWLTGGRV